MYFFFYVLFNPSNHINLLINHSAKRLPKLPETTLIITANKNSSGDEIANVNFLR